jgi:hypothetical protein
MLLNSDIILTLAGLTLTFYALFARMLVKFDDKYSRNLLYFLLANMVSVAFTVVFVLSSLSKGIEQNFSYLSQYTGYQLGIFAGYGCSFCCYFA